ncbi:hypothetical protein [Streptomyces mirabilis]|uniref:hypothetical protein n=1 Tax=Streptomyces mirabilis TaxID=68239 RepID=UPI00225B6472|nr:hypothetical protein [Streptomyces mirabilis]MCX4617985.1 hypothetical protein [Streptomyces mirabilis]
MSQRIAQQLKTHPRAHVVEPEGYERHGVMCYRAQVKDLAVGDTLASFGKVLEWSETGTVDGWRLFRMVTEHPQHYPVETNVFVVPEYCYYGITALAEQAE